MDTFFRNLRKRLSVDNLFMKGSDEPLNKEEDLRKTLEKTEPNDIIHVTEITEKLNEITELSKKQLEEPKSSQPDKSKSNFSVLQKTTPEEEENPKKQDNVMAFLD
ncbi:uncharacterized protein LOC115448527 [Manduca sexta]|uniref:Uncharacterized protein n=1 Tax=Manduca sexta TaxID=7130 RepID=A0A922CTP4_MANSE|nr:uncharacterized protein LOC115448527 [Manduca sexta]KAG6457969.1 hypothetical protein O3G_MSEX010590 [Manduca sexta]